MRRPEWLTWGATRKEPDGSLTPAERQALLEGSPPAEHDEQLTSRTLVWLAWLVAGFGLILLVAWNWTMISGRFRIGGAAAVTLSLYGAAWLAGRRGAERLAEMLALAGALAVGAVLLAIAQSLALLPTNSLPLLFWALAIAVTAIVSSSPITTALGTGVLLIWVLTNSGTPPAPWAFVLVFPSLAIAIERRTHPYAAGLLTLALGVWVALIGRDIWQSPFIPGVMAIAAGAAIDSWAHLPSHRRPAFASVTPAVALVVFGLGLLGAAAIQGAGPPALWGEPAVVLPGIVLVVSLTAIALWPSVEERQARWRPQVFGGLVVVWIGSALAAGGQVPVPAWWYWTWMALPSLALLALTITAVREGVTAKNTGLFVVGVAAILALVVMHFAGEVNRAGQSVAVLFAAAGVLWLVSRVRLPAR